MTRVKFLIAVQVLSIGLFFSGCAKTRNKDPKPAQIQVGQFSLNYRIYKESVPGIFYFSIADSKRIEKSPPTASHMIAIESGGAIRFRKDFENREFTVGAVDFKSMDQGLYSYFMTSPKSILDPISRPDTFHLLSREFQEVLPRRIPADPDLDHHDVARKKNGNLFFLFNRYDFKTSTIASEIQEWTQEGKILFKWRARDHISLPPDVVPEVDALQVNSINFDSDGGLILSFRILNEVVKVAYPSGKVLWRLSSRTWKFVNDPYGGFRGQHSVQRLSNGNLLVFDNRDSGSGEPKDGSRAVEYRLDVGKKIAEEVWEYRAAFKTTLRRYCGSVQRLSNGNTLIGWGRLWMSKETMNSPENLELPIFTEVTPSGDVVRELVSSNNGFSYRVHFEEFQ